jgi:hypothetical protein
LKKPGSINFKTKNARQIDCKLQYGNKFIANLSDTKFLALYLPITLGCRGHIEHLVAKLSTAWYASRSKTNYAIRNINNDMLCLFSLINHTWHNILR